MSSSSEEGVEGRLISDGDDGISRLVLRSCDDVSEIDFCFRWLRRDDDRGGAEGKDDEADDDDVTDDSCWEATCCSSTFLEGGG
jgi:hypothetical protein